MSSHPEPSIFGFNFMIEVIKITLNPRQLKLRDKGLGVTMDGLFKRHFQSMFIITYIFTIVIKDCLIFIRIIKGRKPVKDNLNINIFCIRHGPCNVQ